MQIIDPRAIPQSEFPFIVSCAGSDWISRLIQFRTESWCNHSMLAVHQGKFIWESMNSWYGEGPMKRYMTRGTTLKFYRLVDMNNNAMVALENYTQKRINSPWYHKAYDWLGIIGQAIGLPKIHTPGLEYCSVDAIHALKAMGPAFGGDSENMINLIPDEENPGYLDRYMDNTPSVFKPFGVYQYGVT